MDGRGSFDRHAAADLLTVAAALAAPVIAAGDAVAPRLVVWALASVAFWLSPVVRRPPLWVNAAFLGLVLCGAFALLPLADTVNFPWRRDLAGLGVTLGPTVSAQPWLTFAGWLSLVAGAAWAWFLLGREWHLPRRVLLQVFGAGALLILLWWVGAAAGGRNLSGVTSQTPFGTFPNRNQSANFAALAGLVFAALALHGRLRRWSPWPVWLVALAVAGAAVVASGSRAGVLLLVVGVGAWFIWMSRALGMSRPVFILLNGALLLSAGLLAFGGDVLKRFSTAGRSTGELAADFRLLLYRDAVPLLGESSWHGIGMGNFGAVFARYRDLSFNESRALHPDSDWIWFTAELGWLAPVCVLALLWFALRQCRPFHEGSERVLRSAGLIAALAFLAHSLVDVPGHRATLWPALFLLGLACSPTASARPVAPYLVRTVAAVLSLAVCWQCAVLAGVLHWPAPSAVLAAKPAINAALDRGDWSGAARRATDALRVAPLDWELYFGRASARVMLGADTRPAQDDFAIARYLEPNQRVAFDEGVAWLVRESDFVEASRFIGPRADLAAAAWQQVFARPLRRGDDTYGSMIYFGRRYPEILPYLRALAGDDPARLAEFLPVASAAEVPEALAALLAASPDLAAVPDRRLPSVLRVWAQHGDRERLLRELPRQPRWVRAGWVHLGDALAARGEVQRACELARAQVAAPDLPPPPTEPVERLRDIYTGASADIAVSLRYFQKLIEVRQYTEALRVLTVFQKNSQAPDYTDWLEADLRERMNDLPGAWTAWRRAGLR